MACGYTGRILRINLSSRSIDIEEQDEIFYRTYIGGRGFTAYYLLKELEKGIDPLGPKNKLIFACGVLTGTPVSGMARHVVGAKSPITGGLGQSEAGGFWGTELKRAGYDAIIVEGKSEKPVYIVINDEDIRIMDAQHLWGKETGEAQDLIHSELGENKYKVAQIGPGGEKLVKYSCIVNDLKHFNGRNGMGAVMGSKNLKAIAVKGTKEIVFSNLESIRAIGKRFADTYMNHPLTRSLYEYGTSAGVSSQNAAGILPTKNFIFGEFKEAQDISGEIMAETILKRREGCYACAVRCKRVVEVDSGDIHVGTKFGGPEYETIGAFGSLCGIGDLGIIAKANELCNRFGIDTISTGATIAFVMECFEKGILSSKDTGGLDIQFGNGSVMLKLVEMIGKREGIGDLLAEGSSIVAKRLGKGAEEITICVKGQEAAMHDPRGKVSVGIGYAISENGTDHMVAAHDVLFEKKGIVLDAIAPLGILEPLDSKDLSWKKVRMFTYLENWWSFFNMAGVCYFGPVPRGSMPMDDVVELVKASTGWNTSMWEVMKSGERAVNMSRIYNLREGLGSKDDTLPERFFNGIENGRSKGASVDKKELEDAICLYYEMMGWNTDGVPGRAKLLELNLDWLC